MPVTASVVSDPTLVMLGCAAVVNVPVNKLVIKLPVAALNERLALAVSARLPVADDDTNVGKYVPVVPNVTTSKSLTFA